MSGWEDAATAVIGALKREVFYLSGEDRLYASMYSAFPAAGGPALVICPSWGHEMFPTLHFGHALARRLGLSGGAGLVLHWPGHGDSGGEPESTDGERMGQSAEQALEEARRRASHLAWALAGARLGAAAAVLAAVEADAAALLLIRPALDQARYFSEVERASRRAGLGRESGKGWAFGHPLPHLRTGPDVNSVLARFPGPVACIAYEGDPDDTALEGVAATRIPGSWEVGAAVRHARLVDASVARITSLLEPARD